MIGDRKGRWVAGDDVEAVHRLATVAAYFDAGRPTMGSHRRSAAVDFAGFIEFNAAGQSVSG